MDLGQQSRNLRVVSFHLNSSRQKVFLRAVSASCSKYPRTNLCAWWLKESSGVGRGGCGFTVSLDPMTQHQHFLPAHIIHCAFYAVDLCSVVKVIRGGFPFSPLQSRNEQDFVNGF